MSSPLQALVCGPLLYPLAALLSDPMEGCRAKSLALLDEAARQIADVGPALAVVLPELVKRMGNLPVQVCTTSMHARDDRSAS